MKNTMSFLMHAYIKSMTAPIMPNHQKLNGTTVLFSFSD